MTISMIQLIILMCCCAYIIISINFKKFKSRQTRACLFMFIVAGIISYTMKHANWLDFLLLLGPIMFLYQFEDLFKK